MTATPEEVTFENDYLSRKGFADDLTRALATFHPFYDEAFVLGLNGAYGTGKTTFVKMWKNDLEKKGYKAVYFNAWENDFADDALIPIVNEMVEQLELSDDVKKAAWEVIASVGLDLIQETGVDVRKAWGKAKKAKSLAKQGQAINKVFVERQKIYTKLREELTTYVNALHKKPLIIFIDELDRAKPDFAIKCLEAIKHIFAVPGLCFVLSVDRVQLKASIRQVYGDIEFEGYYLRFVQREADLPELGSSDRLIKHYFEQWFENPHNKGVHFAFYLKQDISSLRGMLHVICTGFGLTPRQIESLIRKAAGHLALENNEKWGYDLRQLELLFILLMLSLTDQEKYHAIGQGTLSAEEFYEYVNTCTCLKAPPWKNYDLLYTMVLGYINDQNFEKLKNIAKEKNNVYLIRVFERNQPDYLFPDCSRNATSIFQEFYRKIQRWEQLV